MWVILLTGYLCAYTVQDFRHAEKFLIGSRVVLHQYSPVVCPIISLSSVKICMNTAAMLSRRCFHCLLCSSFAQDFFVYGNQDNTTTCLSGWSCLLIGSYNLHQCLQVCMWSMHIRSGSSWSVLLSYTNLETASPCLLLVT